MEMWSFLQLLSDVDKWVFILLKCDNDQMNYYCHNANGEKLKSECFCVIAAVQNVVISANRIKTR